MPWTMMGLAAAVLLGGILVARLAGGLNDNRLAAAFLASVVPEAATAGPP
jgi:hypothetical protein